MKATDALKLSLDEFLAEVSRAISKKPWPHKLTTQIHPHTETEVEYCSRCLHATDGYPEPFSESCAVPPKLDEPLEVVARKLRDKASQDMMVLRTSAARVLFDYEWTERGDVWKAIYTATPQEQIACCLVALGLWEV